MRFTSSNQQVLEAIDKLSEEEIQIVLEFIQTLQPRKLNDSTSMSFDPLDKFVGAINNGNLAQQIDKELYE
jgi:hypothetical protein